MSLILSGTDGLSEVDGTAATPAIRGTDANTGIFFPAADTIAFAEGGAEIARFDSAGNLGIGKSTITAKLDVQRTSGTTEPIGRFEAAVGSYTGTSLIAANTLNPDSAYNLFSCISDSDGDAGGPFTEFSVRGDGLVFMDSGYGSAAAAYGCRAWVNFNGTGTVAIRASGNVSSITDNGTGDYTVNFTTAMPDANYSVVGGGSRTAVNMLCITARNFATSSVNITPIDTANNKVDSDITTVAIIR
jgi:hypothetical protein